MLFFCFGEFGIEYRPIRNSIRKFYASEKSFRWDSDTILRTVSLLGNRNFEPLQIALVIIAGSRIKIISYFAKTFPFERQRPALFVGNVLKSVTHTLQHI